MPNHGFQKGVDVEGVERKREEGRGKREEERGKREEGRGKTEEGRGGRQGRIYDLRDGICLE